MSWAQSAERAASLRHFKPYPSYKGSGVEWLGEIPAHWDVSRLGTLFHEHDQRAGVSALELLALTRNGLIPRSEASQRASVADDYSKYKRCEPGMLVMNKMQAWNGAFAVAHSAGIVSPDYTVFKPRRVGDVRFFTYLLRTELMQAVFLGRCRGMGSAFLRLNTPAFAGTETIEPPVEEQHAIAAFLDRKTAEMDALIVNKERLIELLQEKRTALITRAVTKGLDPNVPMKDSGVEWLGRIPGNWQVLPLRRVIRSFVDYRGATPEKVRIGVPLITARNIKDGMIDFDSSSEFISEEDYETWMVRGFPEVGDLLITTEAPLGETAQITEAKVALAQRVILLKAYEDRIANNYLKFYFSSAAGAIELWTRATGSTAIGIKAYHLKEVRVTVPPIDEQIVIADRLDREIVGIDTLVARVRNGSNG